MVNTEQTSSYSGIRFYYNILNIVVNTERDLSNDGNNTYYNILNIVVNTEPLSCYV